RSMTAFITLLTFWDPMRPIRGMEKIKMTVRVKQEDQSYDQYYPETHTCFSMLDLPLYSTKEIMKNKLTEALSNNKRNNK
uniref:HECT domain-containing protein n=1 Tax=Mola mola TaxID=94237 RepID=A0A3Q3VX08_MOLML